MILESEYRRLGPRKGEWSVTFAFSNQPAEEFGYYGGAFLRAARVQARSYCRRKGHLQGDKLPLLFLYRHSIELLTKGVLISGNELMSVCGDSESVEDILGRFKRWNHRLQPMLPHLKRVFEYAGWHWYWPETAIETFEDLAAVFEELDRIDPNSHSFRYPVRLKGGRSIPADTEIELARAITTMDEVAEALETAEFGLDAQRFRAD
jgi:hypothetical protein